jgi:hypothetical protein
MTIAHSAAHKGSADGYIHACRPKIVSINPSLTLIMAASVAAEHHGMARVSEGSSGQLIVITSVLARSESLTLQEN